MSELIGLEPVRRVILAGNRHQDGRIEDIKNLLGLLRSKGISICIERRFADYLSPMGVVISDDEVVDSPDSGAQAAISIGGDGTFLRTARWIGCYQIPVLGINTGHLGFLAIYTPQEMEDLVEMLYAGHAVVEERTALMVEVDGECADPPELPYALNEVAILKDETSSMINVNVNVEGHYLANYLADGLLISTPTGSTGYNLSAGGPILSPSLNVICITPVAPHTLTFRPFVVSGDEVITAFTTSRAEHYRVSLDGVSFLMKESSRIRIRKADFSPRVIRRLDDSFADTLRNKLLWGLR